MGLSSGILLIILGGMCMPSLTAKKRPWTLDQLERIAPWQSWFGLGAAVLGIYGIVLSFTSLNWIGTWPLWWMTRFAGNIMVFITGVILSFAILHKYLSSRSTAATQIRSAEILEKLVDIQGSTAVCSISIGCWVLLYEVVLHSILSI